MDFIKQDGEDHERKFKGKSFKVRANETEGEVRDEARSGKL